MAKLRKYEGKIKSLFGIHSNLSSKQTAIIESWQKKGINEELIKTAYDLTLDNTGKLSFPYMNKILLNWEKEGIKTSNDIEKTKLVKAGNNSRDKSYNLGDFEKYSINFLSDKKEE